jgi:hypothetical protein
MLAFIERLIKITYILKKELPGNEAGQLLFLMSSLILGGGGTSSSWIIEDLELLPVGIS